MKTCKTCKKEFNSDTQRTWCGLKRCESCCGAICLHRIHHNIDTPKETLTVMKIYEMVMQDAHRIREQEPTSERASGLYWVAALLEETEEINPKKK